MFYSDPVPHIYHGDTSTYTVEMIDMMKNNTLKYYGVEIDRNLKYYKDYETTCARRVKWMYIHPYIYKRLKWFVKQHQVHKTKW